MNWLFKIVALCASISIVLSSDVLDFSGPDFESRVAEHDAILIEFFAPWYVILSL